MDNGLISVGQVVGLIRDIPTVKEVVEGIVKQADEVTSNLSGAGLFRPCRLTEVSE